jgi:hypothetical protein
MLVSFLRSKGDFDLNKSLFSDVCLEAKLAKLQT